MRMTLRRAVHSSNHSSRPLIGVVLAVLGAAVFALPASGAAAPKHPLCNSLIPLIAMRKYIGKPLGLTLHKGINAFNVEGDDGSECEYNFVNKVDYYGGLGFDPAVVTVGWGVTASQFRAWLAHAMKRFDKGAATIKPLQVGFGGTASLITEVFGLRTTPPLPNLYFVEVLTKHNNVLEITLFGKTSAQAITLASATARGL